MCETTRKTVGKLWKNMGENMEVVGKLWERIGKKTIIQKLWDKYRGIMGWLMGNPWDSDEKQLISGNAMGQTWIEYGGSWKSWGNYWTWWDTGNHAITARTNKYDIIYIYRYTHTYLWKACEIWETFSIIWNMKDTYCWKTHGTYGISNSNYNLQLKCITG